MSGQNIEIVKLQIRRGLESQLPILDQGEPAITTDTNKIFVGDGATNHELAHKTDLDATNVQLADISTFNNYSTVLTKDNNGNITKIELKDGTTVIQTTNITRDSNGNVASVQDIANGKTVTTTINRASDGTVSSTSKAVI